MEGSKGAPTTAVPEPKPKYPQYAVPARRAESFKSWPDYLPQRPDKLIEAGLVYTGVGDSVRCYHCGGGLRSWEEEDDPWVEHAKWYPWCPHVLLIKGQTFVDKVGRGENPYEERDNAEDLKKSEERKASAAAIDSCIQMGYPDVVVRAAADFYVKEHGHENYRGEDLCEIIFKIEETEGFQKYQDQPESSPLPPPVGDSTADDTEVTGSRAVEPPNVTGFTYEEPRNVGVPDSALRSTDLEKLQEENQRLKDNQQCKICMDAIADVIFLPCGHMISCAQCAPAMFKCPVCRQTTESRLRAYLA